MTYSLKIKLNCSWKFWRNWNVPSWCYWKDLDKQDLMEFIWKDLDSECGRYWFFNYLCHWKFKVLEGKISWGHGNTWANGTSHIRLCFELFLCT
jgi:hypothetical protein